jgi:hypothetical protein
VDEPALRISFAGIEEWKVREEIPLKCVVVLKNAPVPLLNDLQTMQREGFLRDSSYLRRVWRSQRGWVVTTRFLRQD